MVDTPVVLPNKPWYTSKTLWAGVLGTLRGIYQVVAATLPAYTNIHLPPIPPAVDAVTGLVLGSATIHGRWTADTTLQ